MYVHRSTSTTPLHPHTQASPGVKHGLEHANSFGKGFEYSRTGNPTRGAFERAMAAVEHGKHAVAFASGLAATVRGGSLRWVGLGWGLGCAAGLA